MWTYLFAVCGTEKCQKPIKKNIEFKDNVYGIPEYFLCGKKKEDRNTSWPLRFIGVQFTSVNGQHHLVNECNKQ